jgi:nitrogen-specific signal transduction histidine kinase
MVSLEKSCDRSTQLPELSRSGPEGGWDGCSGARQASLAIPGSGSRVDLPLAVTIQDNGPGIPEDLQPHLFDPFVSTKAGGSGLGLALVAKIIGDHGGVIEFDSHPRRTAFRLMLPMAPREEGDAIEAEDALHAPAPA